MFVSYIEIITELDHLFKINSKGKKTFQVPRNLNVNKF